MTTELSRPLLLQRIGPEGYRMRVEASAAECAALTRRMGIPAVHALACDFDLARPNGGVAVVAEGDLTAVVTQICVVSLDDFEDTLHERFRVIFVPADTENEDPDPEEDDEIPFEGDVIDLGEAAAEQLALALDPYPRKPGAELPADLVEQEGSPFAALAALRDRQRRGQ
jgi:uncharacterized metal-binding protein YceD (DUF177 family)